MATKTETDAKPQGADRWLELAAAFPLRPIRTDDEAARAVAIIDRLTDIEELTPEEEDYLLVLSDLVADFEDEHEPEPEPDPAGMVRHLLDTRQVSQKEASAGSGVSEATLSQILAGKKTPSRKVIEALGAYFKVDPRVLRLRIGLDRRRIVSTKPLSLGIHGATGRMGTRLIHLIAADPTLALGAAIDRPDHPSIGRDVGPLVGLGTLNVSLRGELDAPVDAVIDFSAPAGSLKIAEVCRERSIPLVVATTGFEPEQKAELEKAADRIPLLISPNLSRAVNLLMKLVGEAARALGDAADVEIVERHHHFKKDAPSGTAARLAEIVAREIGSSKFAHGREGLVGERPRGEIGLHALRTGDNPGEHTVVFGLMGECLELSHRALNRDGFARGALDAARKLVGRPPRLYSMLDILG